MERNYKVAAKHYLLILNFNIMSSKSDIRAKKAFCKELIDNQGFGTADIVSAPADIKAVKDNETWYFEIKKTTKHKYFGAATETEWKQAFADPDHYRFVVALTDENEEHFEWFVYTPMQMLQVSTIPPFKINFNINLDIPVSEQKCSRRDTTIALSESIFHAISSTFERIRTRK
jgi:hypothetical protein